MIDPADVPDVDPKETLARFVFYSRHIRSSDETIKPDAFMPHPNTELSVTRDRDATEAELWAVGKAIGAFRRLTLHGRGDVQGIVYVGQGLELIPDPIMGDMRLPDNPNHANVTGWSDEKARQKLSALEIASRAKLLRPPPE